MALQDAKEEEAEIRRRGERETYSAHYSIFSEIDEDGLLSEIKLGLSAVLPFPV